MSSLWEERLQHDPPRYDVPFGLGSIVAVPGPMVIDMEVDRPGPPLSPASRGTVSLRQHIRKVFPAMDVERTYWSAALKPMVSGIATEVMLFSTVVPCVWKLCAAPLSSMIVHVSAVRLHTPGLC